MSEQVTKAIEGLKQAVTADPAAARAVFRAVTVSTTDALSTDSTIRGFGIRLDEPPELGGSNSGPNPVEAVLAALGSCQAIIYRAYASALGLRLDRVEIDARGYLDVRGFLGLAPVPPGFERVTFAARVVSPEPAEKIKQLADLVARHCPVLDILRTPLEVAGTFQHVSPNVRDAA